MGILGLNNAAAVLAGRPPISPVTSAAANPPTPN
jgi:hypothetical protein